jgi:peroxidase
MGMEIHRTIISVATLLRSSFEDQWNTALLRAAKKMLNKRHVVKLTDPVTGNKLAKNLLAMATFVELQNVVDFNASLDELQSIVIKELPEQMTTMCESEIVYCPAVHEQFRTMNGSCNNIQHPLWGSANHAFKRYLPADYDDGVSAPRGTKSRTLPSARNISLQLSKDIDRPSHSFSLMLMQWGQFLDHDITLTPAVPREMACNGTCNNTKDFCFSIQTPDNDPVLEEPCMMFGRSVPSCDDNKVFPWNQLNRITSFIDASNVYGSSDKELKELRDSESIGLMRVLPSIHKKKKSLLPHQSSSDPSASTCRCRCGSPQRDCFKAGDTRVNAVTSLTAMHTIWMREHNWIASQLADLNRCWDSDRVFFETRKIIGAIMQHITYNEYLPLILGKSGMAKYSIKLHRFHASTHFYDPTINPAIANVFAAAAFRFGHSQLQNDFPKLSHGYWNIHEPFLLNESFFCPSSIYNTSVGGIDSILRGLLLAPSQTVDLHIAKTVTNHLFSDPPSSPGLDLFALNIQRGRDHGIPSYTKWRQFCGFDIDSAPTFDTLGSDIPPDTLDILKSIYKSVDDIDLFVGGLAETHVQDGAVGKTFQCILGHQFHDLQHGDRFWYETPNEFTRKQLHQIKQVSLAKVLCNNGDSIRKIQPKAFERAGFQENLIMSCRNLPEMDIQPWTENSTRCLSINHRHRSTSKCVSGSWGHWSHWTFCSKPCGVGEQTRMRACNDTCLRCKGFYLDSKCCRGFNCNSTSSGVEWG